ncbi:MAG: DNA polymerase I [Oscillospiraceae bacterium]|nr:DNA polymerase I [Oscillospiraceae bacterium]
MKLMILDGNSVINRAFYGVRLLSTRDGQYTNAIYGFLNILDKVRQEETPDALCVAFDLKGPTFRHERYEQYKATRHGMPEELAQQLPVMKQVLGAMNIPIYACQGWEADDVIGTVAKRCAAAQWDCVVVTGDRDSLQLVDDHITVKLLLTKGGQTNSTNYTPELFQEEYGFEPIHLIDLKALMGDNSDNIPGVAGVGPKTATELLKKYGTLDGVYENLTPQNMKGKLFEKLESGKENAYLSYELATIRLDAPVEFTPGDALVTEPDRKALYELFLRLEFVKLIDKYRLRDAAFSDTQGAGQTDAGGNETISLFSATVYDGPASNPSQTAGEGCIQIQIPESRTELETLLAHWKQAERVALAASEDLELLALDDDDNKPVVLRRNRLGPAFDTVLSELFSGNIRLLVHGSKELLRRLLERCLPVEGIVFDTELAAYLLDAARGKYELPRLALDYCHIQLPVQKELMEAGVPAREAQQALLLAESAALLELYQPLRRGLQEQGLETLFYDMDLPLCRVLAEMEVEGVLVDAEALYRFDAMLKERIAQTQADIFRYSGGEFNINSPKQLGEVLFSRLGLPAGKKTKTGWSTNVEVLEKLRDKHPIIGCIMEYRMLTKLQATYAEGLLKVIGPDGRVRTTFQNTVTATGRLSSTDPNLQNIPVRTDLGAEIRRMFVPAPGCVFVDADYSQIELRVLAHMAGDEAMKTAFNSGEDVHRVTASQVFGVPLEAVTPQMRRSAKAVNFGIVYGISEFSLAEDLGVSRAEAKAYIDSYLQKYHGVRDFMAAVVEQGTQTGYVATLYGRRRYLPELRDGTYMVREAAKRMAMNSPIQGTAADIIKLAMLRVDRALRAEGLRARLVLQVHDELIVECPEAEAERVQTIVTREMEAAAALCVPLNAEAKIGRSWYEAK